jgi:dTDP-4-amino-4,6-dideoxygalactose transaminase
VFVDIDARTWVMDVNKVLSAVTPKTKAVLPVHLYGNMVDMSALSNIVKHAGNEHITVIEDVAQAQGSRFSAREAGTLGRFGAYSFYPSKNIGALGDGGAVFCQTAADMLLVKSLRNYGQKDRYHAEITRGINSRLDEVQAAILDVKLKRLDEWNKRKSNLMSLYRKELAGLPIQFQEITRGCEPAWHLCVLALHDGKTREALMSFLAKEGIQTLVHYPVPNHRQKAFESASPEALPVTEDLAKRILSLPFNTAITQEDIGYMIGKIRSFFA